MLLYGKVRDDMAWYDIVLYHIELGWVKLGWIRLMEICNGNNWSWLHFSRMSSKFLENWRLFQRNHLSSRSWIAHWRCSSRYIYLSLQLYLFIFLYISVCLSFCLFVCLLIYLSIYLLFNCSFTRRKRSLFYRWNSGKVFKTSKKHIV